MLTFFSDKMQSAIAWTLLHSLWQGLLLTVLAGPVLLLTRRSTAALRYTLLSLLFFSFLAAVSITFLLEWKAGTNAVGEVNSSQVAGRGSSSVVVGHWIKQATALLNANVQWIVSGWLFVFLVKSARMIREMAHVKTLRRCGAVVPEGEWTNRVQTLAGQLGIQKAVLLVESALVNVPVVIGYFKPLILVPVGILNHLPPGEVEAVLLHELAHIRRHDYVVNFVQRLSELLFFFNPGFLWLSSLLRSEREACCDEIAISRTGNKLQFVEALIRCKEHALKAPAYSLGFFGNNNQLLQRLNRIADNRNKSLSLFETAFLSISLLALTALLYAREGGSHTAPLATASVVTNPPPPTRPAVPPIAKAQPLEKLVARTHTEADRIEMVNVRAPQRPLQIAVEKVNSKISGSKRVVDLDSRLASDLKIEVNEMLPQERQGPLGEEEGFQMKVRWNRAQAEKDRWQAQADRAQADKDREQAFLDRLQAEKDRLQVERDRELANQEREKVQRQRMHAERERLRLNLQ